MRSGSHTIRGVERHYKYMQQRRENCANKQLYTASRLYALIQSVLEPRKYIIASAQSISVTHLESDYHAFPPPRPPPVALCPSWDPLSGPPLPARGRQRDPCRRRTQPGRGQGGHHQVICCKGNCFKTDYFYIVVPLSKFPFLLQVCTFSGNIPVRTSTPV